jgi:hypothetical protein
MSGTISEYTNVRENRKGNEESTMETQAIVGKLLPVSLDRKQTD